MFTQEEIQQLKSLYSQEFGEEISDEQVVEYARVLLNLLAAVYKPSSRNAS